MTGADLKRGVAECLIGFKGEVCLNHMSEGDFRLVEGNRIALVAGSAVNGYRMLPSSHPVAKMDVSMRAIREMPD